MTDAMEAFEKLLKIDVPPASEDAKKTAISSGMEAFDQQFSKARQGMGFVSRLMDAIRAFHNTFPGGHTMKTHHFLIGGTCAIALSVVLLSSSNLTTLLPQSDKDLHPLTEANAPASPPAAKENTLKDRESRISLGELPMAAAVPQEKTAGAVAAPEKMKEMADKPQLALQSRQIPIISPGELPAAPSFNGPVASSAASPPPPPPAIAQYGAAGNAGANYSVMKKAAIAPALPPVYNGVLQPESDMTVNAYHEEGRDKFDHAQPNPVKVAKEEPVSTFSIDVDTSSYSFMRASLNNGVMPQKDGVRIEELINYFPYEYQVPESKDTPFKANVAVIPTPWNSKTKIIHIGIKGYEIAQEEKPRANLVFLIDTSGSMNEPNKLPLLRNSLKLLLDSLKPEDRVSIVTYAGNAGIALEPTEVKDKTRILGVLDRLQAYGSTAGAEGIRTAYQLAEKNFDKNGINRVILSTDGDFNVGITDQNELKSFIERERDSGIFLSVLGFGMGNYNDAMMQSLAQNGNGNAAYIDNLNEARKALVEEAGSTLFTIAKDVKIQVEFNPAKVAEYRLIGYETRILNREDFNNDKVDAGEIGSGHAVTALYEITPADSNAKLVDDLRYQNGEAKKEKPSRSDVSSSDEYAFVKIRYKLPDSDISTLIATPVDSKVEFKELATAPQEARFATAVAAYGQLLRGDAYTKDFTYGDVITLAQGAKGTDDFGYRAEFINLVRLAEHAAKLPGQNSGTPQYAPRGVIIYNGAAPHE